MAFETHLGSALRKAPAMWPWLGAYALTSILDSVLTWDLVGRGEAFEANPIAAEVLRHLGWGGLSLFKAAVACTFLGLTWVIARCRPRTGLCLARFACVLMVSLVGYSLALRARVGTETQTALAREKARIASLEAHRQRMVSYLRKLDELSHHISAGKLQLAQAVKELGQFIVQINYDPTILLENYCDGKKGEVCLAIHLVNRIGFVHRTDPATASRLLPRLRHEFTSFFCPLPAFALQWFPDENGGHETAMQ